MKSIISTTSPLYPNDLPIIEVGIDTPILAVLAYPLLPVTLRSSGNTSMVFPTFFHF